MTLLIVYGLPFILAGAIGLVCWFFDRRSRKRAAKASEEQVVKRAEYDWMRGIASRNHVHGRVVRPSEQEIRHNEVPLSPTQQLLLMGMNYGVDSDTPSPAHNWDVPSLHHQQHSSHDSHCHTSSYDHSAHSSPSFDAGHCHVDHGGHH